MFSSVIGGLRHPHGSSILGAAVESIKVLRDKRRCDFLHHAISLMDKGLSDSSTIIAICRLSYLLFSPENPEPKELTEAKQTGHLFWKVIKFTQVSSNSSSNTDKTPSLAPYIACSSNQVAITERKFFSVALLTDDTLTNEMLTAAAANLYPALFCEYVLIQLPDAYKDESVEMLELLRTGAGVTQGHLEDVLSTFPQGTLTEGETQQLREAVTSAPASDVASGAYPTPLLPIVSRLLSKTRPYLREHLTMYSSSKGNPLLRILYRSLLQLDSQKQSLTVPGPWLMIQIVLAAAYAVKLQNKVWADTLLQRLLCIVPTLEGKYSRILGLCAFIHLATSYDTDTLLHAVLTSLTLDEIKLFLTKVEEWMKMDKSSIVLRTLAFQGAVSIINAVKSQDQILLAQLAPSLLSVAAGIHHNIRTFMNILNAFAAEVLEFQGSAILSTLFDLQTTGLSGVSGLLRVADDVKSSLPQTSIPLAADLHPQLQADPSWRQATLELIRKEKYGSKYGPRLLSSPLFQDLLQLHAFMPINVISFYRFTAALETFLLTCCIATPNNDSASILLRALESDQTSEDYNGITSSETSLSSNFSTILDAYLSAGEHLFEAISTIYDLSSGLSSSLKCPAPPRLLPSTLKRLNEFSILPDTFGYAEFFIVVATARVLVSLYLQDTKMVSNRIRSFPKKAKTSSIVLLMGLYLLSDIPEFYRFSPDCASFLNMILPLCINLPLGKRKYRESMSGKHGGSPCHSSTNVLEETEGFLQHSLLSYSELSYSVRSDGDSLRFHRISLVLAHILYTALSKQLCDLALVDDYLLIMVYISTGVFSSADSSIESMDIGPSNLDEPQCLLLDLTSSWLSPTPICKALLVFLFSNNMPLSLCSDYPGMFNFSTWNAKLMALRLLDSTLDLLPDSARREALLSSRFYFHKLFAILTELLLIPLQPYVSILLSFLHKVSNCLLSQGDVSPTSSFEVAVTFPDEPLELIECTKKCIPVSGRMPEPLSYIHYRYRSASRTELFSCCAVLDDGNAITSLYAYLRALIAAHIKRLQEKIASGTLTLVPLEKHAIQHFLAEKRASSLSFSQMFPGMRFLGHSSHLVVGENLYAYFCGENSQLYQETYTYWYDCFMLDLLFNAPDTFSLKLFNEYEKIKQTIGQQIKDRKKAATPFSDCYKALTHFIYTHSLLSSRRLLQASSVFSLERASSLQSILSTSTSLATTEPSSRVNSMIQLPASPGVGIIAQGTKDSLLTEQDRRYQVELNIVLTTFWDIYDWARDKNAFSVRTIMHFGQCISAVSSSLVLAMITLCEQRGQSTAASVLLKCYADFCNAEQYYRPVTKLDEAVAAAERIGMVVPRMTSSTYQLEQCCKALIYFATNKSYLLFMDTTAYVLDALLRLPTRPAEFTTAQVLMHLLGYVVLYSGIPRLGRAIIESPIFHRSTGNISKLADSPSYSTLYKANVDTIAEFLTNKNANVHSSLFVSYPVCSRYRRLAAYSTTLVDEILEHCWSSPHSWSTNTDDSSDSEASPADVDRVTVSTRLARHCAEIPETPYVSESILDDDKRYNEHLHRPCEDPNGSMENLLSPELNANVYPDQDETHGSSSIFDVEYDPAHTLSRRNSVFRSTRSLRNRSLSTTHELLPGDFSIYRTLTASIADSKSTGPPDLSSTAASFTNFLKDESRRSPPATSRSDANTIAQLAELKRLGYFHMSAISSIVSIMQLIDLPSEARALILGKVCLCITFYESSLDHKEFFRTHLANRIIRLLLLAVEQRPQASTIASIVLMFFICANSKLDISSLGKNHYANLDKGPILPFLQPLSSAILSYFLSLAPHILLQSIYGRYALQRVGVLNSYVDFIGFQQLYPQCIGHVTNLDKVLEFAVLWCDASVWFHILKVLLVEGFMNTSVDNHTLIYRRTLLKNDGDLAIRMRNLTFIRTIDSLANGTIYRATARFLLTLGERTCIQTMIYLISKCTIPLHGYRVGRLLYSLLRALLSQKPQHPDDSRSLLSLLCQLCRAISMVSSLDVMGILSAGLVPLFQRHPEFLLGILSDRYIGYQDPSSGYIFPRRYSLLEPRDFIIRLLEQQSPEFNLEKHLSDLRALASKREMDVYVIPGFRRNLSEMKLALFELLLTKCCDFISMGPYLSGDYEKEEVISDLIYIYHIIRPPLDSSDTLSHAQYSAFTRLLFEKNALYNSLLQLAVYVGHMSWDHLSQDGHKMRKHFVYSVLGLSVLNVEVDVNNYSSFITSLEAIKFEDRLCSPLLVPFGCDTPGFFVLSSWVYQVLVVFWEYSTYSCEFNTILQNTLHNLKAIKSIPVWEREDEGADYVDSADGDMPVEKLVASLSLPTSPQGANTFQSSNMPSSSLAVSPANTQASTLRIKRPIKLNSFGLLDCSMLCLLLIVGSNKKRMMDYTGIIIDCYDWACSILNSKKVEKGLALSLTLYASLFLLSSNRQIINANSKQIFESTCQLVNTFYTVSQRSRDQPVHYRETSAAQLTKSGPTPTDLIVSTVSDRLVLSHLCPDSRVLNQSQGSTTESSIEQVIKSKTDQCGILDHVNSLERSTVYGYDVPVITTPYLLHLIHCLTAFTEFSSSESFLDTIKSLLILVLRHSQVRRLLPELASLLELTKGVIRRDTQFILSSLIPSASALVCYQTAADANITHRVLGTLAFLVDMEWNDNAASTSISDALARLYSHVYTRPNAETQGLLAFFAKLMVSEEISSYTQCNLLKLLTTLVEKGLFSTQEILSIIENILRNACSESVAAQCLISASVLLSM
ncbi:Hypothetical protein GLP15_5159 [Giardia lamblia P15]|uniref:Uncharacterized protein n=1 Tax=Giardia intestinalis (strain P15) TaxID=658858 RepID=E1EW91_GIAIA|nr:Hypothetical protein GLP15_5159 [Giardia lamblia P15]